MRDAAARRRACTASRCSGRCAHAGCCCSLLNAVVQSAASCALAVARRPPVRQPRSTSLNRAAPLVLVALGMTLVIATRGIDISVGAVVAIAGAVGGLMIGGAGRQTAQPHVSRVPMRWRIVAALGVGAAVRPVERPAGRRASGMQPIIATLILMVAGRGIAQLHHRRPDHHDLLRALLRSSATASCSACRSRCASPARCSCVLHAAADAHARSACSSRPSASTRWRRAWPACARARITLCALRASAASAPASPG